MITRFMNFTLQISLFWKSGGGGKGGGGGRRREGGDENGHLKELTLIILKFVVLSYSNAS